MCDYVLSECCLILLVKLTGGVTQPETAHYSEEETAKTNLCSSLSFYSQITV